MKTKYSYDDRVDMLEADLRKWTNSFKKGPQRNTAIVLAFEGTYFNYGGPANRWNGKKFLQTPRLVKQMQAAVQRKARKYRIPAYGRLMDDYGNFKPAVWKKYGKKLPLT